MAAATFTLSDSRTHSAPGRQQVKDAAPRTRMGAWLREVHRVAGSPSAAELEWAIARNLTVGARVVSRSGVHRLLQGEFVRPRTGTP
ncbi:hypothetical protein [Streptomyces sp. NPDC006333]|uniref:hypothetical protein n=1 Tax=Streptomyces sp. NPDC006333 TaxID=3156753 RepID=UPI0033B826A1